MSVAKKASHTEPLAAPRGRSRYADKRLELTLAGVRAAANKTQVDVSRASGIAQGEVSKIENREDLGVVSIATLRKYVTALGGELELIAKIGAAKIVIRTEK